MDCTDNDQLLIEILPVKMSKFVYYTKRPGNMHNPSFITSPAAYLNKWQYINEIRENRIK